VGVAIDLNLAQRTKNTTTPVPAVAGVLVTTVIPGEPAARAGIRGAGCPPRMRHPRTCRRPRGLV
jgi:S1-C subfamily serine protease